MDLLEPREALHKMKKIGGWFTKGIPNGGLFRQSLNECTEPGMVFAALERLRPVA
jgi:hypothetical protein